MSRYIVDGIFFAPAIHLVAGASGVGKTSWLLDTLVNQWAVGLPVLGGAAHPEPWAYVSGDRSRLDAEHRIMSLGLPLASVPLIPAYAVGTYDTMDWEKVLIEVTKTGARTVVWEGFGRYVGDNAKGTKVDRWLEGMTMQALRNDLCIIGVVEQPKMKPRDKYPIPRQRVSGPAAWGHHTQTIILIEAENERVPTNPNRVLYVLSHDSAPQQFKATIAGGHFTIIP